MADILEAVNIQWHPGFYGAAELEFLSNKGDLEFQREFNHPDGYAHHQEACGCLDRE